MEARRDRRAGFAAFFEGSAKATSSFPLMSRRSSTLRSFATAEDGQRRRYSRTLRICPSTSLGALSLPEGDSPKKQDERKSFLAAPEKAALGVATPRARYQTLETPSEQFFQNWVLIYTGFVPCLGDGPGISPFGSMLNSFRRVWKAICQRP